MKKLNNSTAVSPLFEQVKGFILSKLSKDSRRKIGIEIESFVYNKDLERIPIYDNNSISASEILNQLNRLSSDGSAYSLEPGGQIEWASPPYLNLNDLNDSLNFHNSIFEQILKPHNLFIIPYGVDPFHKPEEIELIDDPKYVIMDKMMKNTCSMGQWMMRNTTSIQVNIDFLNEKDTNEILFIADCLHPIIAFLFSYSPFTKSVCNNFNNQRNLIWKNTDNRRSNNLIDHGIFNSNNILDKYIEFVLNAPTIYSFDQNNNMIDSFETISEQLQTKFDTNKLKDKHIHELLRQIFTNVRLKNVIEIRGADRLPAGNELAPAAFWTGILFCKNIRKVLLDTLNSWTTSERYELNNHALSLKDNTGPLGKPFFHWVEWACDLAMKGLIERDLNEKIYFENFYKDIIQNDPLSIQEQSLFNKSEISLKDYIKKKFSKTTNF
tara:strand:+ start:180 stop:1493 length:1314 start_codon:yes stop_codon:yes gene_type:complete